MINIQTSFSHLELPDDQRNIITSVIQASLNAVDPYLCVEENLHLTDGGIITGGQNNILESRQKISLVSLGKASLPMTQAVFDVLGHRVNRALCICKHYPIQKPVWRNTIILQGSHPIPDEKSLHAARAIHEFMRASAPEELLLFMISGGGSALLADPEEGISVPELQQLTELLFQCGASIQEINCLRKHIDRLKGGKLVQLAPNSRIVSLILSDVVGNPLEVIASGITVPDPSTYRDAWRIIQKYGISQRIAPSILLYIYEGLQGLHKETPKEFPSTDGSVHNFIIGSNEIAAHAALNAAPKKGMNGRILTNALCGEARLAGEQLSQWMTEMQEFTTPSVWIAGGETTVKISGQGRGGRNLEAALGAVRGMAGCNGCVLITLATDGEDGPTDAAGALVTGETLQKASALGLDPDDFLVRNDSYSFFEQLDQLILTGPTNTNVNDLNFLFKFPEND